jgi:hypothetical protein
MMQIQIAVKQAQIALLIAEQNTKVSLQAIRLLLLELIRFLQI